VSEQAPLDVLVLERFLQQAVVAQIDGCRGDVVRCTAIALQKSICALRSSLRRHCGFSEAGIQSNVNAAKGRAQVFSYDAAEFDAREEASGDYDQVHRSGR
jgi:hypothetical protein